MNVPERALPVAIDTGADRGSPYRGRRLAWPQVPLRTSLASLSAIIVACMLSWAASVIVERRTAAYAAAGDETTALAIALAEQTSRVYEAADLALQDLVEEVRAQRIDSAAALAREFGTNEVNRGLRGRIVGLKQLSAIGIVDAGGGVVNTSSVWPAPRLDLADRDYFRVLRDAPSPAMYVGEAIQNRMSGNWAVNLSRRLEAPDGRFIGVAVAAIDLSYFETLYQAVARAEGHTVGLWRQDGTLLARYPRDGRKPGDGPNARAWLEAVARSGTVDRRIGPDGEDGVFRLRALPDYPLIVMVGQTEAAIGRQWRPYASAVMVGAAGSAVLLLGATLMVLRQIRRRELSDEALRRQRDELERLVAERTRALALSASRHRDVAELASDWFWEIDADGRFVFLSSRFAQMSGIATADILGWTFDEVERITHLIPEERDELLQAIDGRTPFADICLTGTLPDGRSRQWLISGKPFFDGASGRFAGFRGTGTDVTAVFDRELALTRALRRGKAAEEAAESARARLLDAVKVIPAGFALWDAEDRLVVCNDSYRALYSRASDLILPGIRFEDLVRAAAVRGQYTLGDQDIEQWVAERVAQHRTANGRGVEQRLADGRWLLVEEQQTADGGVVGIGVDVTEAHRRERIEREQQKLAALGELAGGVAHEINNLLQPVLTLPSLVQDRLAADDVDSHADLAEIVDSARRMRDIVRNILLFARRQDSALVTLDLAKELKATLAFVGGLLPPTVTLRQVPPQMEQPPLAAANPTQLTQVLTNLVVNAAQAMVDHGVITVTLRDELPTASAAEALALQPGRRYFALAVADTGCGMDADTQKHIFEPFFTTKPVGQGTGLGLSVVYGILRSWQGAIAVDSAPGRGTAFTLYIPALDTPAIADADAPRVAAPAA